MMILRFPDDWKNRPIFFESILVVAYAGPGSKTLVLERRQLFGHLFMQTIWPQDFSLNHRSGIPP